MVCGGIIGQHDDHCRCKQDGEIIALRARIAELEGAASADHQRMVDAASKAGVTFYGCDTADHMADRIAELEAWREEDAETIANFARAEVEKDDRIKELERKLAEARRLLQQIRDAAHYRIEHGDAIDGDHCLRAAIDKAKGGE
jgi:hypothetical protein